MCTSVAALLDSQFDEYSVGDYLHEVPPHEVQEVIIDGQRAVCKRNVGPTGSAGLEGRIMAFLDSSTSVPVPETLAVGEGYYVTAWDPDAPTPGGDHEVTLTWARAAGRTLGQLHTESAHAVTGFGTVRPTEDSFVVDGHDQWRDAAIEYVRDRRSLLGEHGHEDVADAVVDLLESQPDCFAGAGGPVLCHGWWTPEHVATAGNEVTCVVDFEHAIAAPPEFDYWRAVTPRNDFDDDSLQAFREGYESVAAFADGVDQRRPYYLLLVLVYYFESLYVQDQHTPEETEQTAEQLRESVFEIVEAV